MQPYISVLVGVGSGVSVGVGSGVSVGVGSGVGCGGGVGSIEGVQEGVGHSQSCSQLSLGAGL